MSARFEWTIHKQVSDRYLLVIFHSNIFETILECLSHYFFRNRRELLLFALVTLVFGSLTRMVVVQVFLYLERIFVGASLLDGHLEHVTIRVQEIQSRLFVSSGSRLAPSFLIRLATQSIFPLVIFQLLHEKLPTLFYGLGIMNIRLLVATADIKCSIFTLTSCEKAAVPLIRSSRTSICSRSRVVFVADVACGGFVSKLLELQKIYLHFNLLSLLLRRLTVALNKFTFCKFARFY